MTYSEAGVDIERAESALQRLIARVKGTWPSGGGLGAVMLDIGYFANVVDIGGVGLAITTDGVGSKVLVAQMVGKYDTVGIDCVAMNVNDLLCVGARPLTLVDYLAVQDPSPDLLDAISIGLAEGARQAGVSIPGGEIAQLREVVQGVRDGLGFDLAASAVGLVPLDRIIVGQAVMEGDVLVGLESNGIHSNGLTLAREVLLGSGRYSVDSPFPGAPDNGAAPTIGEELLRPTFIYVPEILAMMDQGVSLKALMHVTGDGFLNLNRVDAAVGFVIEQLPEPPAIFSLIQHTGAIRDAEMYRVFNMGVGFCVVVPPEDAERAIEIAAAHGRRAQRIGRAIADPERRITIEPLGLVSKGKRFVRR